MMPTLLLAEDDPHSGQTLNSAEFIDRADKALYKAKSMGRNCVATYREGQIVPFASHSVLLSLPVESLLWNE